MDRRENRSNKRSSSSTNTGTLSVNPTVPSLTPAQMYSNFEEWIKMCTDNKVNATNTWNFALIDYFHEMTFIREGDSINFQKASCTLDGCVKIYTSRVDSVATETGKLLSGLADSSNGGGDGDDESRQAGERRTRRKTQRSEATLLKDFSSIALKKFDLDFAVDPLFKKTSADFDEGGARGLLLNHLGIDQHCKIIFDASDATIECDTEELDGDIAGHTEEKEEGTANETQKEDEHDTEEEEEEVKDTEEGLKDDPMQEELESENVDRIIDEPTSELDKDPDAMEIDSVDKGEAPNSEEVLSPVETEKEVPETSDKQLDKESLIEISRLKAKLPTYEALHALNIVPSLKGFDFFTENDLKIPNLDHDDDDAPIENPIEEEENPFQFDDYDIDYGADDIDPFAFDENNDNNDGEEDQDNIDNTEKGNPEQDYLQAMLNNGNQELFNYFDTTLNQNWAGPEHWKLRRAPVTVTDKSSEPEGSTEKPKRKSRADFQIAFDEEDNDEDEEELFAPGTKRMTLTKEAISKLTKQLLPDDIHFSSKQLLQYFLKPMFPSGPKRKVANINTTEGISAPKDNGSDEPDINFWAEQTQDFGDTQDFPDDIDYGYDDIPTDAFENADTSMLNSFDDRSFYHDTYDDPEVSVLYGDALITNHNLKKTKPLYVNYARTAKRVDVKKLKDNLWKALTTAKADTTDEQPTDEGEERVHGVQKFSDIVHNLKKMYSPKTMRDISVPFCFICLLHLANEKDLSIVGLNRPGEDEDDFVLGDDNTWMNDDNVLNEVTIVQN